VHNVVPYFCEIIVEFVRIVNLSQELPGPLRASFCNSFLCRLRGLMFRRSLPKDEGLLLVQTTESRLDSSIHMLFMWFDITAIWLNADKNVVDVQIARQGRPYYAPTVPAQYTLEVVPYWVDHFNYGDQIAFEPIRSD